MKARIHSLIVATALAIPAFAEMLGGYTYQSHPTGPDGNEWQDCSRLALNKEQPRATFYPFESVDKAMAVLPEGSKYWKSLDGTWKFRWVPNPWERDSTFHTAGFNASGWDNIEVPSSWNVAGLRADGSQKYGTPIYVNQPVIFMHTVAVDDWRGGVMRTPPTDWTTYKARNEVGQYLRTFTIPSDWKNREIYISFDGVDSFFYLWINGHYVGFSKNSRNAARFNITPYLKSGGNTVAVEVYRSSDGSFLESQDMFRLPGIFRTVALYSTPKVELRDLVVIPSLSNNNTRGTLAISASVRNLSKKDAKGYSITYTLFANKLYSDNTTPVTGLQPVSTGKINIGKDGAEAVSLGKLALSDPRLWSAEAPWRYTLVAQLKDNGGDVVETVSVHTGFRQVEIRDTPASEDSYGKAGRYYYINGQPVKLRGVNRHESMPDRGHAVTRAHMKEEVMMMKRANINHVRNSHYPDDPYWYELCDKYGIYLEDEGNLESHEYYYGDASLSHPVEWRDAHVARDMEMVHSNVNHPSIVIWSLGNEGGPGDNYKAAYEAIKKFDESRPVQYERNNHIVDMGSNQYPSIELTREIASGKRENTVYPFHISEFAHSMGNALGNLADIWREVESSNFICGGAIWDWIDQALYNYDAETGTRYLAYGGDFGDTPNHGQFMMNGIIFADMEPKPQYFEVKKVYQPVEITPLNLEQGEIEIFNKNFFVPLDDYTFEWTLFEDGKEVCRSNVLEGPVQPLGARQKAKYRLPYNLSELSGELAVRIEGKLKEDKPWAKAGYVQVAEQFMIRDSSSRQRIADTVGKGKLVMTENGRNITGLNAVSSDITVSGNGFKAIFNAADGSLSYLEYEGKPVIVPGHGPHLDPFRAFVNNDIWIYEDWYLNGLHNLHHKALSGESRLTPEGNAEIRFSVLSQAPNGARILGGTSSGHNTVEEISDRPFGPDDFHFTTDQVWTVYPDGSVELDAHIVGSDSTLVLPRIGYSLQVPEQYSRYTYYGRGPVENYADRKTGQFIGIYTSSVKDQFINYPKPQNMANREEVRWASLTDSDGFGIVAIGNEPMSVTAIPYDESDLVSAPHPYQLPPAGATRWHLDLGMTGLGGRSCGQAPPVASDRVKGGEHHFGFILRPVTSQSDASSQSKITLSGNKN